MWTQRLMWIAWPAFLMAGIMEMAVFAFVDPEALQWFDQPVNLSRQGVYTIAFFVFWIVIMASGALTTLLWLCCNIQDLKPSRHRPEVGLRNE